MTTMTRSEREAERQRAIDYLRKTIPDRRSIIHTRTDYTRGQTDYVTVYVVRRGEIIDISYYVARAAGRRMTERGIAYGGGQYSKALEAADDAWRARFGEAIPQTDNWRELS